MIKKFLECTTVRERIDMLSNTVLGDWSDQDLNIILSAFDLKAESFESKADKISAIEQYLANFKRTVEKATTMNCEKLDSMPVKEPEDTLYEEKGLANVIHKVFSE